MKLGKDPRLPDAPLAVRVLAAATAVRELEGTVGQATREELVELLRELAEGAKAQVPDGYCPQCGFRPSMDLLASRLCRTCGFLADFQPKLKQPAGNADRGDMSEFKYTKVDEVVETMSGQLQMSYRVEQAWVSDLQPNQPVVVGWVRKVNHGSSRGLFFFVGNAPMRAFETFGELKRWVGESVRVL